MTQFSLPTDLLVSLPVSTLASLRAIHCCLAHRTPLGGNLLAHKALLDRVRNAVRQERAVVNSISTTSDGQRVVPPSHLLKFSC